MIYELYMSLLVIYNTTSQSTQHETIIKFDLLGYFANLVCLIKTTALNMSFKFVIMKMHLSKKENTAYSV